MFVFRVVLAALLVTCTQAACPTVEPVPGTSPNGSCITRRSGTASGRQCIVTMTQGFDISVSPRPINRDLYNGYRYLYGTEVNITCTPKTTDPLGSQDLIFLYPCSGNKDSRLWSDPSPNMTTLTLSSSSPAGRYWLSCWAASCTCDASLDLATCEAAKMSEGCMDERLDNPTLITVLVGHPSPQPTNFWCMSYDWLNLRCGWTLGSRVDDTVWSVSYWPPTQNSGSPIPCRLGEESTQTVNKGQEVNVTCTVEQQYFLRIQTFVFQVSDNNVFGRVRENFTTMTDRSIIKLIPINGLRTVSVPGNSTVLNVSWELADRTRDTDCEWRVGIQAKGDVWMAMDRRVEYPETVCQSSMLIDGLHAYVTYTVQIQIRLKGSQYWSDETKVQATTPEDKPSQSPELTQGGYITGDCRHKKCLSLYWKSVPAPAQNGEIIYYQVVVKENGTIVTNTTQKTSDNSMTVYIGQRDDVTLVVELSAGTSVGFSSPPSRIDIPPRLKTSVPRDPEKVNVERQQNSVNAANATYTMTWSALPGHDQDDYVTVFWCKGHVFNQDASHIVCLAGMEWTHLAPNITAHTLDLADDVCRQWYFGVSRTRRNVSRGVTWNRCLYDYMGVPSKPTLQASTKSETEMTVSWDFNMCDITFLKGLPVTYEIFYRKTDSANPSCLGESVLNVTAEVGVKSEVLPNLIYGATYGVCMRILTARNASDLSDVKLATVETLSGTDRSNVPVFAGVLAAIVAVIMAIGILVFRWKLQLKATMFPSGNLWLPKPKTHGRWDLQIPVEQSLGTGSLPSHTIQVSDDVEIHDRPVTLTGVHNLSSWVSPVLDSNFTSSERRCGHRDVLSPANISQPSLHGGYISESSLCKSYDVRINNIPRNGYVPASLPSASPNFSRNDAVEGSVRSQNSPKTLDCSPDRDDERAVASDSARDVRSPRSDVERSGYIVLDNTVADKKTHSSYNTTTLGADATTPYVTDVSKILAERFTYKSQHPSVRKGQGRTFPVAGYLSHHELSDKMSLTSTTGMLTMNEESPSLDRIGDVSWADGHSGNVDINISFQEREEEDKHAQPLMTISPSGYVMEDVHIERALTEEIGENWRKNQPDEQAKPLKAISPGNVDYVIME